MQVWRTSPHLEYHYRYKPAITPFMRVHIAVDAIVLRSFPQEQRLILINQIKNIVQNQQYAEQRYIIMEKRIKTWENWRSIEGLVRKIACVFLSVIAFSLSLFWLVSAFKAFSVAKLIICGIKSAVSFCFGAYMLLVLHRLKDRYLRLEVALSHIALTNSLKSLPRIFPHIEVGQSLINRGFNRNDFIAYQYQECENFIRDAELLLHKAIPIIEPVQTRKNHQQSVS